MNNYRENPLTQTGKRKTDMACISAWDEPEISIDEVVRDAQTGDLVLFRGRGLDAWFIQCMSGWCSGSSRDSHVGVVVVVGKRKLITEAYPTVIGKDVFTGTEHTGVQVVDLRARLTSYPSGHVTWRPMAKRKRNDDAVASERFVRYYKRLMRSQDGLPQYNLGGRCFLATGMDWFEYGVMTDGDDNGGRYVCTQWAVQVLRVMGMAHGDGKPGNVSFYQLDTSQPPGLLLSHYEYGACRVVDTDDTDERDLGAPRSRAMRR